MPQAIRQSVIFRATPHDVYEALMDSSRHTEFTGDEASISRVVGGPIMAYGGYVTGKNLELIPDEKIVQAWRASDWPEGQESTATFTLSAEDGGTRLTFVQEGVPDEQRTDIEQGWIDYYWTPMKAMLEK
jgi:activator of HSP90 ATPase